MNEIPLDERLPSPVELNQQLLALYDFLPGNLTDPDTATDQVEQQIERGKETILRRARSETKERLINRMRGLLALSPATDACKEHIIGEFGALYNLGTPKGFPQTGTDYGLVSARDFLRRGEENGGIFHLEAAQTIEEAIYIHESSMHKMTTGKYSPEKLQDLIKRQTPSGRVAVLLERWKDEFTKKYGRSPQATSNHPEV